MARHTRQIIGGAVAFVGGIILGRANVAHGSVHDALFVISWAVYLSGIVLFIVGLVVHPDSSLAYASSTLPV